MKLIIVGGVAGGASAATRARRINEDAEIVLFERGKYISFANCGLPYHIGGDIKDRGDLLVTTPAMLKTRFKIDVRILSEVVLIDSRKREVEVKNLRNGKVYRENYDKLIIASGAEPVKPPIPGIDLDSVFTLRSIPDMDEIKKRVDGGFSKSALVVGGGFIGIEMAENLAKRGLKVVIVEMADQLLAPLDFEMASVIHQYLRDNGVELKLGQALKSLKKEDENTLAELSSGETVKTDMVIMAAGVKPDNRLAFDAGIKMNNRGGIKTDEYLQTNLPDVYAVGDVIEVRDFVTGQDSMIPLAGPANRQGRIAADNAMGRKVKYKGTQGTSIVKILDLTAASTGNNEKQLKKAGIPYRVSYVHAGSHASYFPGAQSMAVKLVFSPEKGRILGAQIVGMAGVDKRIDVIATAIRAGMTVFDLEELELAYAPPYSSAKDPVNMAGFTASNILRGDVDTVEWDEVESLESDKTALLDVRDREEVEMGEKILENSLNIPLNNLRDRLAELDKDKEYVAFCGTGRRSYIAARILTQNGFQARNFNGGFATYSVVKKEMGNGAFREYIEIGSRSKGDVQKESKSGESGNPGEIKPDMEINACAVQCPGPIMKLKTAMGSMKEGEILKIMVSDHGFKSDAPAWCKSTGNQFLGLTSEKGVHTAYIRKGVEKSTEDAGSGDCECKKDKKTIIVFSDDLDRALASFIIANGAASMGSQVTMFFTFWGLNVIKKNESSQPDKDFLANMFGMMMPKGADKLTLSKMNFAGMGTAMMKHVMKNKNVESLGMLIQQAQNQGVKLVACNMTMDIMGIRKEELIDGVYDGGVATYLSSAGESDVNLFI